jgi:uncharacterized phage-associated protein
VRAAALADAILAEYGELSTMKLQKLLYYCQAWHLAWFDEPLVDEAFQAWEQGPVVPEVWRRHRGRATVQPPTGSRREAALAQVHGRARYVLEYVLAEYGSMTGDELSDATHAEAPYLQARAGLPEDKQSTEPIDLEVLGRYFRRIALPPEAAVNHAVANAAAEGQIISEELRTALVAALAHEVPEAKVEQMLTRRWSRVANG